MTRCGAAALAVLLLVQLCGGAFAASISDEVSEREKENSDFSMYAATQGMVLLENKGALPMASHAKVALFGYGARSTVKGGTGSGAVNDRSDVYGDTVEEGLLAAGFTITSNAYLDAYGTYTSPRDDLADIDSYITQAKNAGSSYAIYVVSRNSGEGSDRSLTATSGLTGGAYYLTANERANIEKIAAAFDKTIVVLNTGGIMDTKFFQEISGLDGLVLMSQAGPRGGEALGKLLSGQMNFSGKLTDTWAVNYEDYPSSATFAKNDGDSNLELYTEDIYVGYRYFDTFGVDVAYPFGYGLSYTKFNIETQRTFVHEGDVILDVKVTNTGSYSGKEVVQVYFTAPAGQIEKPRQELAAYAKTKELEPGESETLSLSFPVSEMSSYNSARAVYVLEKGNYILRVGDSSRSTTVAAVLTLAQNRNTETLSNQLVQDQAMTVLSNKDAPLFFDPREVTQIEMAPHIALDPMGIVAEDYRSPYDEERITSYVYPGSTYTKATKSRTTTGATWLPKGSITVFDPADGTETIQTLTRPAGLTPGAYTLRDVAEGRITMTELVADMTPEELVSILFGDSTRTGVTGTALENMTMGAAGFTTAKLYESRQIPNLSIADGHQGLRITQHYTTDGVDYYQFATRFPIATLLAMSWDVELLREFGSRIGQEMTEFGVGLWIGPGMNIHRNPLCGRNFEYYSEDPLVTGLCAAYVTLGCQSWPGVGAILQHFATNNQETNRNAQSNTVTERALREIYLKGYEIAVKLAQPMAVMNAYNRINSVACSDYYDLNTDVLRGEWGFEGLVLTDWGGGQSMQANQKHAGCDLTMPGGTTQANTLLNTYFNGGYLPLGDLQSSASRILNILMQTLQFEQLTAETSGQTIVAKPYSEQHGDTDAYNHRYETETLEPTCTEPGGTRYTCTLCGDSFTSDEVEALGHDYQAAVTAPTCTEAGFTTYTCTRCGDTYVDNQVPALGHEYVDGVCIRCGQADPDYHPSVSNPFIDVKEGDYFYDAVLWAVNADPQVTSGTSATTFSPNNPCTRGQVVTFLWRAKGCPEPGIDLSVAAFNDVVETSYYYKAVLWAVENSITQGTSTTTFSPNSPCTRGQVVTFLYRFEHSPEPTLTTNPFTDVSASAYYYKAVLWAVENSITQGTSPTKFSPNSTCTRGQVVTFLYRDIVSP